MTPIFTTEMLQATNVWLVCFVAFWPVLPFRETKNFIRFGLNSNCIVFTIFQHKIIFSKSQPRVYSIEYVYIYVF